ncbi:MAG: hypothetical protein N3D11_12985 [Candidatus Sumerlaeia bacterium]|nr:hypothetical protein [Candidatus Sumerlaeia bacterium]
MRLDRRLRGILWCLLSLGILRAGYIAVGSASLLHLPFESSRPELYILYGAKRLADGEALYRPLNEPPFAVSVYNPLTYFPGWVGRVLALEPRAMLLLGRYVSWVASVGLSLLLGLWIYRAAGSWTCAGLAALGLWYFQPVALTDCFRLRPESPALLLTFCGVAAALSPRRAGLYAAAGLFFLAWLFKQSFIAAPISVFVYFLVSKQIRRAAAFAGSLGALLAVFLIAMYRATGGVYFENTFMALAANDIRPFEAVAAVYGKSLALASYGLLAAWPAALYVLLRMRTHIFWVVYTVLAFGWAFFSAGKLGAQVNYYSEFAVAALVAVALAVRQAGPRLRFAPLLPLAFAAVQVVATFVFFGPFGPKIHADCEDLTPYLDRYASDRNLILHEGLAVHTGQVAALDFVLLEDLWRKRKIDLVPIFSAIARREFPTIVLSQHPMTQLEMRLLYAARKASYRPVYADDLISQWALSEK